MIQVTVSVNDHQYPIFIHSGLIEQKGLLQPYIKSDQIFLVSNETVGPLYAQKLASQLSEYHVETFLMPDGEQYKSFDTFQAIMDRLIDKQYRRNATLIALGGGVVGDITGFAAACYQRGVDFIQVPTSLLAMVDSSVGGKTAINHPLAKNMIGAFYQPNAVLADLSLLETLPQKEFLAGLAEVIKYGLIQDIALFDYIEQNLPLLLQKEQAVLAKVIQRCCEIKADIVNQDEKEQGIRAVLNLGHTFGHAIEKAGNYQDYVHGEAVAIGMCMASDLSAELGLIELEYQQRISSLLERSGLPVTLKDNYCAEELLSIMCHDKKNQNDNIRLVLPIAPGEVDLFDNVDRKTITEIIKARQRE